jgi:hypothetical protein
MGILQIHSFSLASVSGNTFGSYFLFGLAATLIFLLLIFLISKVRRGFLRLQAKRVVRYRIRTVDLTSDYRNRMRHSNARKGITAGIGMAVLASMFVPVPATAHQFNLADRLLKNPETLNRMQTLGAAILIPDEFRQAQYALENVLRHTRAVVTRWAFRKVPLDRQASTEGTDQDSSVDTIRSLKHWTLRRIIEHDSAGVEISRKVQTVARLFALLRPGRQMLCEVGDHTLEQSVPEPPNIHRERAKSSVAFADQGLPEASQRRAGGFLETNQPPDRSLFSVEGSGRLGGLGRTGGTTPSGLEALRMLHPPAASA